jgi:hypothetical protein
MKQALFMIATIALMATSCKKSETNSEKKVYQPLTAGSYWKYNLGSGSAIDASDVMTIKLTGGTITINSLSFQKASAIKNSLDFGAALYYGNGEYIISGPLTGDVTTCTYLKDNLQVGQTWEYSGTNGLTPIKATGKVLEKGITKTVTGKQYTNVIHTQVNIKQNASGVAYTDLQTSDFYVADGVGIIEIRNTSSRMSDFAELAEYYIK